MENKQAGVLRLCIIIIFFGTSIFFLNNNKKRINTATHIDILNFKTDATISHFSLDQTYDAMKALFLAQDIELIAKVMSQFKSHFIQDIIEKMICDETICISYEEKIKIIYGVIASCGERKNIQYDLLDCLIKYPHLHAQTPALLTLARSKYSDIIALFLTWNKDRQKNLASNNPLSLCADQAFTIAIQDNDGTAVEVLFSKKVRIAHEKASALLWYVVEHSKESALVSLLVHHAQADVNYVNGGKTLLIAAVENNNTDMVRVLLDEGAIVDRIINNEKGSALHIAMKNDYALAEQLLREYGAA